MSVSLSLGAVGLAAVLCAQTPPLPDPPEAEPQAQPDRGEVLDLLLSGVEAALAGQRQQAMKLFPRAALMAPDVPAIEEAFGTAALLLDDHARAQRILARTEGMSTYRAMAQIDLRGGFSKARTTLSNETKLPDAKAEAGALYLAALAFFDAGQKERSHKLLKRALAKAPSALDEAFAPDPAAGLARATLRAAEKLDKESGRDQALVRLSNVLLSSGRRSLALELAEEALERPAARAAGLRVLVLIENASSARRALDRVERILAEDKTAEDARVAQVLLLIRLGEKDRARKLLDRTSVVKDPELDAELKLARAELSKLSPAAQVQAAESAVRAAPKSDRAVATLVRALLRDGKPQRAKQFADALLERHPKDVDPYALLAEVQAAMGHPRKVKAMKLRSEAFLTERRRLEAVVNAREEVFRAIRDAEAGVGVAGLAALRDEHPRLSLSLDLAIARLGGPGAQHTARERILERCAPKLRQMLKRRETWDFVEVEVALYGPREKVRAPLSAAEPTRCAGRLRQLR